MLQKTKIFISATLLFAMLALLIVPLFKLLEAQSNTTVGVINESYVLEKHVEKELLNYLKKESKHKGRYYLKYYNSHSGWLIAFLYLLEQKHPDEEALEEYLIIGKKNRNSWYLTDKTKTDFAQLIWEAPENFLDFDAKNALSPNTATASVAPEEIMLVNQPCYLVEGAFTVTNSEFNININRNHDPGSPNHGAVDLGANLKQPRYGNAYQRCEGTKAVASVAGTIEIKANDGCGNPQMLINMGNGKKIMYLHMDHSAANTAEAGDQVVPGTIIGTISDKGCTTFKHIHYAVYVNGAIQSYNNWKFTSGCVPPQDGTWLITQNCEVTTNLSVQEDVIIDNNSTLNIKNNAWLDFDFINYKIIVKQGSKIIIENGSKLS